jgi:hypothetical protein
MLSNDSRRREKNLSKPGSGPEKSPREPTAVSLDEFLKARGQSLGAYREQRKEEVDQRGQALVKALKQGIKDQVEVSWYPS